MDGAVEREVDFTLAVPPWGGIRVPVLLAYRSVDPLAVRFSFHADSETPIVWSFGRELLTEGLYRPCGAGDVQLSPGKIGGQARLYVSLASLDGEALLSAPADSVRAWLRQTERLVAPGTERIETALDAELRVVMASASTEEL
jgi:hypothetical protein